VKCQVCQEREATVHFTEIVDDKIIKLHLCEECAKKKGIGIKAGFALSDFLSTLTEAEITEEEAVLKCPQCGMTLENFRKEGRLGCGQCYETFEKTLTALIKTLHKGSHHTGKIPAGRSAIESGPDPTALKRELQKAVKNEEYEKAARLRDRIKKLEVKAKKRTNKSSSPSIPRKDSK
jgi:protein arginine kinase activator